jgi:drug/metabolite transporter (DMT)-like permease
MSKKSIIANGHHAAIFWMLASISLGAVMPLMVKLGEAKHFPFVLGGVYNLAAAVACFVFLAMYRPRLFFTPRTVSLLREILLKSSALGFFLPALIGVSFASAFFAWSTLYIDVAVSAVVFGTWPLFMVITTSLLFRGSARYQRITIDFFALLVLGLIGFIFVTAGKSTEALGFVVSGNDLKGVGLALAGGVLSSWLASFTLKCGAEIKNKMYAAGVRGVTDLFCVAVCLFLCRFFGALLPLALAFFSAETPTASGLIYGTIAGAVVGGVSALMYRQANLSTKNLGINALPYARPIIAISLLWIFTGIGVARPDFFVIGVVAIIAANLLINFEAEVRMGYKSLILALWTCGAFVYLRGNEFVWGGGGEYFAFLGLSATVFTLILSFRVSRFVNRTANEENLAFDISHQINAIADKGEADAEKQKELKPLRDSLRKIDAGGSPKELRDAYDAMIASITAMRALASIGDDDKRRLAEIRAQIDKLVHSKQQGMNRGELAALCVFAALTVGVALAFRPGGLAGWSGFVVEFFTVLFPAVIVFLFVNVLDLHRDRDATIFWQAKSGGFEVKFRDIENRGFEQWISVILGVAIAAAYGFLLWDKWLG